MTYKEVVKKVVDKVLELNSENIEVTISKDQLICLFLDGAYIQDSIDIHVGKDNTYGIFYLNNADYIKEITVDEMIEMLVDKCDVS